MNKYDDVQLDIPKMIEEQDRHFLMPQFSARSGDNLRFEDYLNSKIRLYYIGLLLKLGIYRKLIYSNLKLNWFYEFNNYWVNELGNRNIEPHDFYYLYSHYRTMFQALEVYDSQAPNDHLKAWQDYRTIYLLFHSQYRQALRPLAAHRYLKYIPKNSNLCEFGCGIAPIATSLCQFYTHLNFTITCADIPIVVFHFTRWKFMGTNYVHMEKIDPESDNPLNEVFDTIFCLAVFEHLPRPIPIVKHLYDRLKPGGYLIFDYINSSGGGLDSPTTKIYRREVLQFILDHFEVVDGQIHLDGQNVESVACRKK